jgi:3-oxoacyl-[acyl-carrier-protein] synthase III
MIKNKAYIRGTGGYVPENVVTNHDLAEMIDTSDEWIKQRSGISERRYAPQGIYNSDLALKATENMLEKNKIEKEEIDCIIFATLSPDIMFPGTGVFLQEKLGLSGKHIPCYDIRQQCSGFIYGLQMAQAFIEGEIYENILVVGSELHSHAMDFTTRGRGVSVLFGDGAGVALISRSNDVEKSSILHSEVYSDGSGAMNGIHCKMFDVSQKPIIGFDPNNFEENEEFFPSMPSPKNLFANAVRRMTETAKKSLHKLDLTVDKVDWLLPHQANIRINTMVAKQLGISSEKVLYNIEKYGNTTAATIPLLLDEYVQNGTIKRGDVLALVAFGSGFTWGSVILKY